MPHNYAPTPVVMTTIPSPDDGDAPTAASVNQSTEALANAIAYLTLLGMKTKVVTATGSIVTPANCGALGFVLHYGGGGGAGYAVAGSTSDNQYSNGGGGGGAALLSIVPVALLPSTTYTVTIGAGGSGGIVGSTTIPTVGGDSIFAQGASELARAQGAGYAFVGTITPSTTLGLVAVPGGPTPSPATAFLHSHVLADGNLILAMPKFPGMGGFGLSSQSNYTPAGYGAASKEGYAGGAPGTSGAPSASKQGGGYGGGGAAGPGGVGGAGGSGGAGNNAGAGGAGVAGTSGAANTGAGGGGGGAGGSGTSAGAGSNGGAGGSGKSILCYFGDAI